MAIQELFTRFFGKPRTALTPSHALALIHETNATVIDLRSDDEWGAGHIHRAKHIPHHEIQGRTREISQSRPVVVACATGFRARRVAEMLATRGFDAHHIDGGMAQWAAQRCPVTMQENHTTGGIIPMNAASISYASDLPRVDARSGAADSLPSLQTQHLH